MFGLTMTAFSVTRMLCFVPIGWWSDKRSVAESLVFCHVFALIGNFLWVMASVWGLWCLPVSRMLVGVSGASAAPAAGFLARTTTEGPERMRAMSLQSGAFILGVLLGPVFQVIFVNLQFTLFEVKFNQYTGAGWVSGFLSALMIVMIMALVVEPRPGTEVVAGGESVGVTSLHESPTVDDHVDGGAQTVHSLNRNLLLPEEQPMTRPSTMRQETYRIMLRQGGWWCLLASYAQQHIISALDTLVTPLTSEKFRWGPVSVSILFCGFAASGIMAILLAMKASKSGVANRHLLLVGCSIVTASCCMLGGLYQEQAGVVAGGCLIAFGCLFVTSPNGAVFSEIIGEFNQGTFNGLRQVAMSFGRIIGPLTYGFMWDGVGRDVFILTLLVVAVAPLLTLICVFEKFRYVDEASRSNRSNTKSPKEPNEPEEEAAAKYEPLLDGATEGKRGLSQLER